MPHCVAAEDKKMYVWSETRAVCRKTQKIERSLPKEMFSFERLIPLHLKADLWQPEKKQIFVLVG